MGKEIIAIAEALSNERAIPKEKIFEALENALATATKKKYPVEISVRVAIDRKDGSYLTYRRWTVVDTDGPLDKPAQEISLVAAALDHEGIQAGDIVEEEIPSVAFDRITIQTAKQVLSQKVKDAEREQIIPHETYGRGDRVKVLLQDIKTETNKGPQIICSRTSPDFLKELFRIEVPEIGEDVIEIMGAARDPGSRAKISVRSKDRRIDPRGACIGMRGARVMAVSNELNGEKIDVVLWDENLAQYVTNAMEPAEVSRIIINEEDHTIFIAVAEENLALAIGKNGQNVRLASQLIGWELKVMTEKELESNIQAETGKVVKLFQESLNIDEDFANALYDAGFSTLEEVAYVDPQELLSIDGMDEDTAAAVQEVARKAVSDKENAESAQAISELTKLDGIDEDLAKKLAAHGIKGGEDLAEQATDDLVDIEGLDEKKAGEIIMAARNEYWFKDEQ